MHKYKTTVYLQEKTSIQKTVNKVNVRGVNMTNCVFKTVLFFNRTIYNINTCYLASFQCYSLQALKCSTRSVTK